MPRVAQTRPRSYASSDVGGRTAVPPLPATARGRRSRNAIVDAAADLMFEHGIGRTSLDEVLEHSGAGKSQLYHYFGGKQDLVRAVIDRQLERILSTQPGLESIQGWKDLQKWHDSLLARHSTEEGPLACRLGKFAGELDDDDDLRPALAAAFEQWRGYFTAALERMRDRGELRVDADPETLSTALLSAVQGGLLLGRVHGDVEYLRASMEMAMTYVGSHRTLRR